MPIYEYRCENPDGAHLFEVTQRMSDGPVTECPHCGATVQRVFSPGAVHFKGFYNTDYGTAKRKRENAAAAESGADKHDAKQAEKKDTATASSDGSSSNSGSGSSSGSGSGDSGGSSAPSSSPASSGSSKSD